MTAQRASHTMTVLQDGRAFIAGGFGGSGAEGSPFRTTELFDPSTNRLTKGPSMLHGRSAHTASFLADGRVFLAGGWTDGGEPFGTAEIDDPSGQRAPESISLVTPRAGHTATTLRDGRVLVAGGGDEAEIFDAATEQFYRTVGSFGEPLYFSAAAQLRDGRVLITGGYAGSDNLPAKRSVFVFSTR